MPLVAGGKEDGCGARPGPPDAAFLPTMLVSVPMNEKRPVYWISLSAHAPQSLAVPSGVPRRTANGLLS